MEIDRRASDHKPGGAAADSSDVIRSQSGSLEDFMSQQLDTATAARTGSRRRPRRFQPSPICKPRSRREGIAADPDRCSLPVDATLTGSEHCWRSFLRSRPCSIIFNIASLRESRAAERHARDEDRHERRDHLRVPDARRGAGADETGPRMVGRAVCDRGRT